MEQATGEAGVGGGGGEDGASDFARDKTKKGGRKFTSCHCVAAHVQLLSIAPHQRSRFATTRQVPPLDKTTADQVPADGEGSTGLRAQTYTRAQLRTLKPCSRCKAQHKGVLYCLRLGHISVPLSALRKKEGMGGKPLGPRALLLIGDIRLLRPQLSAPIFQEGLDRLSGLRPQLFSGIFQFDSAALRGSMTIGRVRESLRYNSSLPTEELSVVQSIWQQTAGWCRDTWVGTSNTLNTAFTNFLFRFYQLHLIMEVDDDGIPLMLLHSRLSFGAGVLQTPWRLNSRTPLDGIPMRSPVVSSLNTYFSCSLYVPERGSIGIRELWLSDTACPKFPEQQKAQLSSACRPQAGVMKKGGNDASGVWGGGKVGPPKVGDREEDQGAKAPAEVLFPLRAVTYSCRENEMIHTGSVYGLGSFQFRWLRVGPEDKTCLFVKDLQCAYVHKHVLFPGQHPADRGACQSDTTCPPALR